MTPITREQARELAEKSGIHLVAPGVDEYIFDTEELSDFAEQVRQQVIADLARKSEVRPAFRLLWKADEARYKVTEPNIGDTDCYTVDTIASLQAKLEQSEARAQKIREAVDDAAYEWSRYVEVDHAPMTLQKYIAQAIDAALNKEPKA